MAFCFYAFSRIAIARIGAYSGLTLSQTLHRHHVQPDRLDLLVCEEHGSPGGRERRGLRLPVSSIWAKVDAADGLAFIAPVFWLHFPAILKGWFERVFAYGSAYEFTHEGWEGHCSGRVPLMHHEKALIISTMLFSEADYKADWEQPMTRIIDDWGLRYPGVKNVEHVYLYQAAVADQPTLQGYLPRAHELGKDCAVASPAAPGSPPPGSRLTKSGRGWPRTSPTSTRCPVACTRS